MSEDTNAKSPGEGPQGGGPAWDSLAIKESIVGIRQRFNYLTELWLAGELEGSRYLEKLSSMVYFDPAGDCWFISPLNGNWYRVTDEGQTPGEPPMFLYRPVEDIVDSAGGGKVSSSEARFCTHCGTPLLEGAMYCSKCGHVLKG